MRTLALRNTDFYECTNSYIRMYWYFVKSLDSNETLRTKYIFKETSKLLYE